MRRTRIAPVTPCKIRMTGVFLPASNLYLPHKSGGMNRGGGDHPAAAAAPLQELDLTHNKKVAKMRTIGSP